MAIVVVGGHSRSVGKTSVVASLIARLPQRNWTACKITQFGHGFCSANGEPCDCQTDEHTIAISAERDPNTGTDSARFLAAGADAFALGTHPHRQSGGRHAAHSPGDRGG